MSQYIWISDYWELQMRRSYDVITQMGICRFMVSELPSCQLSWAFFPLNFHCSVKKCSHIWMITSWWARPLVGWSSLSFGTSSSPHTYPHVRMPRLLSVKTGHSYRKFLQGCCSQMFLPAQTESRNGALWADESTHFKWGFPSERITQALRIQGELNCLLMTPLAPKTLY